jgi:hypothetical protein
MRGEGLDSAAQTRPSGPDQQGHEDDEEDGHKKAVVERKPDGYGHATEYCVANLPGMKVSNVKDAGEKGCRNCNQVLEARRPPNERRNQAERRASNRDQGHAYPSRTKQGCQKKMEKEEGEAEQEHFKKNDQPPWVGNDQ